MLEWQQMTFSKQSKTIGKHTRVDSATKTNKQKTSANLQRTRKLFVDHSTTHKQNETKKMASASGGGDVWQGAVAPEWGNLVWKIYAYLDPN